MRMFRIASFIKVFAIFQGTCALRCWTCDNQPTLEECRKNGRSLLCNADHAMSCQTEVRRHEGWEGRFLISNRCKQSRACYNNELQNDRPAWTPTQCTGDPTNSVCRCCCNTKNCNRDSLTCNSDNTGSISAGSLIDDSFSSTTTRKATCEDLPDIENGVKKCSFIKIKNEIGTKCVFRCKPGYFKIGKRRSVCRSMNNGSSAVFDNQVPVCVSNDLMMHPDVENECNTPPETPPGGNISCEISDEGVKICIYSCPEGMETLGSNARECVSNYQWNGTTPECIYRCNELPSAPSNGTMQCDGDGKLGTQCKFTCLDLHHLIGHNSTKCVLSDGTSTWDIPEPVCKRITCPEIYPPKHGSVSCTAAQEIGSICSFECGDAYALLPLDRGQITCTGEAIWSEDPPCCQRLCPPYASMDVVLLLDSSSSMKKKGWKTVIRFVNNVIASFDISDTSAHFAAFRFNKWIDEETQILFDDYPDNRSCLLAAVNEIPYNGRGTYIGKALRHAREVTLRSGNRETVPDMVWVLTDGKSTDEVASIAAELRDAGVELYALGISRKPGDLDKEQLRSIGGDDEHVLIAEEGVTSLTEQFVEKVTSVICSGTCN